RPYGVIEMVRTGIVAMRRGNKTASAAETGPHALAQIASDENVSYSV
ncbi:MAG TPA: acetolactate synthase small subunit, partial [Candidatus Kapabacteria bacterium]|nr:acetolactate synthase small subunit [Candidatus Kapabacteria bacterium]